jgi:hypothetical protein
MSIKKRKKIKKICMRKEKNIYEFISYNEMRIIRFPISFRRVPHD